MYKKKLFAALLFAVFSCKKKEAEKPYNLNTIIDCSLAQYPDSLSILQKLQGSWTLKKHGVPIANTNKNITLTFDSDSTFSVIENSNIIQQGTFKLINYHTYYLLATETYFPYLGGDIFFCDNELLFYRSSSDGDDNLFEK